ncbi:Proline-rich protein like [Actinidia chinensis var. chinensis]|uniref:Proline-rich protein like n=1 Tax=Actinidia chinensis var. chinensis TaxID=1590841 RepID=A0A2R6Q7U0_ACTCC|nr:Proline-rich protein like [Actinidia chinensis var. chinensis]
MSDQNESLLGGRAINALRTLGWSQTYRIFSNWLTASRINTRMSFKKACLPPLQIRPLLTLAQDVNIHSSSCERESILGCGGVKRYKTIWLCNLVQLQPFNVRLV